MKRFPRFKKNFALTCVVLLFCALALSPTARFVVLARTQATQPPLGTAGNFAMLAASAVTNTGPTVMVGDLGISPGNTVTGFPPGTEIGTAHVADAVALQAQNDLATAYTDAAGQPCNVNLTGQDLGGKTLTAGVYCFSSSAQLTGQLKLDSQGNPASVFIFQISSTLTTASNASVLRINGTQACNIFWQVGSSATFGTGTLFSGNILAHTSITATTGSVFNSNLYAHTGAVTMDTNTITQSPCSVPTPTTSPTVTPTTSPTVTPVTSPTVTPTTSPTVTPITSPTVTPTTSPTVTPVTSPTVTPTTSPTVTPVTSPTVTPTTSPTVTPTMSPTVTPTPSPTVTPTTSPTITPITSPTVTPTMSPTVKPITSPTVTPTMTITPTATSTETPTVTVGPDLSISKTHFSPGQHCDSNNNCVSDNNSNNDENFKVGQQLTSIISVGNSAQTGAVESGNPLVVTDIIPVGLSDIHAYGQDWSINVSDGYSPALVTALYIGTYPVEPDTMLPSIYVSGTLTQDAVPGLTDSAMVNVAGDVNLANNIATDTAYVVQSNHQHNTNQHHRNKNNSNDQNSSNSSSKNSNNSSSNGSSYPTLPHTGSDPFAT